MAAPGGSEKLSKRKLGKYLSQPEFKKVYDHGAGILAALGEEVVPERFNPVLVEFYRDVGYRPDALVNYLLLLGWSLDDRTEDFTRDEMIEHFSLERVNRSAASFDPQKMMAFEERRMNALPVAEKVEAVCPYLARLRPSGGRARPRRSGRASGRWSRRPATGSRWRATSCATRSSSRTTRRFPTTRRRSASASARRMPRTGCGASARCWRPSSRSTRRRSTPRCTGSWRTEGIKIGQIIHAVRVAVTGKGVGFGLFEALEILGRAACLARIDRALAAAEAQSGAG